MKTIDKIYRNPEEDFSGVLRSVNKGKAIPLHARTGGPEDSRKLRFPDFRQSAHEGYKVVSLSHRPPLAPRKYSWYSFLLEAASNPGPQCGRKESESNPQPSDL